MMSFYLLLYLHLSILLFSFYLTAMPLYCLLVPCHIRLGTKLKAFPIYFVMTSSQQNRASDLHQCWWRNPHDKPLVNVEQASAVPRQNPKIPWPRFPFRRESMLTKHPRFGIKVRIEFLKRNKIGGSFVHQEEKRKAMKRTFSSIRFGECLLVSIMKC